MTSFAWCRTLAPPGNAYLPDLKFVEGSASVPLLCEATLTSRCAEEQRLSFSLYIKCSLIDLLLKKNPCLLFLPTSLLPTPDFYLAKLLLRSGSRIGLLLVNYYSQQGKLMGQFIISLMLAQSYCCPCLCCVPSTVLMRIESKLKKLAFVSAASSYDSESREPADLVSKMELLPTTYPPLFFKIVMMENKRILFFKE